MDCHQWGKNGGDLCLEEMIQVLLVKGQEQERGWDVAGVWVGWVGTAQERAPAGIVFAPVVEQRFLIRQVLPATT